MKFKTSMVPGVRPEDFAFTVQVGATLWDVYYFEKDGKAGTCAWGVEDGEFVVSLFCAGKLTQGEAEKKIAENLAS